MIRKIVEKKIVKEIKRKYGDDVNCIADVSFKKGTIIIGVSLTRKDLLKIIFS